MRVLQSQGYSHCLYRPERIDDALAQKITAAFLSMRYDNPEHREILARTLQSVRAWNYRGF